jgi:hypothetical protein
MGWTGHGVLSNRFATVGTSRRMPGSLPNLSSVEENLMLTVAVRAAS